ncbi:GGDEF domain-containing protein [Deinococcus hopiensis]|uniref:GGDEF domain-containing protein n=1 Tax=Deinococcus hopiensis TaxID=309885 RepID=UPI001FEABA58|nr:GGDEF domain-containing protein [Deinococcus hopiensis]
MAWFPLGTHGNITSLLMAVRLKDHPVPNWRTSDQALITAVGRSVQNALDRYTAVDLAQQQARRDALTGLLNRRAFDEDLAAQERLHVPFSVALMDLDGLKGVNDLEGHEQGDKLLRVFATTLSVELGEQARAYRLGGDEFMVLLLDLEEEGLQEAVDVAVLAGKQVAHLKGASLGLARSDEASGATLVALADQRMYEVKRRRQALRAEVLR